jgi:hypothetical protein
MSSTAGSTVQISRSNAKSDPFQFLPRSCQPVSSGGCGQPVLKDESLPDTAVDLIDAAGAAVQLQRSLLLEEVVEIHKREERDNLKLLRENKLQKQSRL